MFNVRDRQAQAREWGRIGMPDQGAKTPSQPWPLNAAEGQGRGVFVALVVSLVGGVVILAAYLTAIPIPVLVIGGLLFVGGTAIAVTLAYREARRGGVSVPRALARAARRGLRWIFELMP